MIKCKCRKGCKSRCKCQLATLPCTELCLCAGKCSEPNHDTDDDYQSDIDDIIKTSQDLQSTSHEYMDVDISETGAAHLE